MRNADREIRGVVYGTAAASGFLGQFVLCLAGGWLFDHVSPQSPFILVGSMDFIFAMLVIILSLCGVIKNDIKIRKEHEAEVLEQRRKIQQEIKEAHQAK